MTGAAFEVIGQGYSGDIVLLIGVKANGELSGVRTLTHAETPGLGDKIELAKDDWITDFNGLSLDNIPESQWAVKKDGGRFDQFTGGHHHPPCRRQRRAPGAPGVSTATRAFATHGR